MLSDILVQEAFGFILISVRLVALTMFVPVIGDKTIPARIRVAFGLSVSLLVYFVLRSNLPAIPTGLFALLTLFMREFLVGMILALSMRFIMAATHTAGTVIAFQTGLAAATAFDPAQGQQSAVVSALLNLIAITLILVTDLHHLMIQGMTHSYHKFPIGEALMLADFATQATQFVSASFLLGFKLASPFIVYGIIYNLGLGLVARMVPGFQVFFIGMPLNILMGFVLMTILLGSVMALFLEHFEKLLLSMIG